MEQSANEILAVLEENGFLAYKVGGCVRDQLLGLPVQDVDVATSAAPEQVMELFPNVIPTGIKHGTVTVRWKGTHYEVTTFRKEKNYHDHRHPDQVEFVTTIEEDLARRDFTVNAMAINRRGELFDPFCGKKDLESRLLRAVGDAKTRFAEDSLRILRGIRFACRLGFSIEKATWEAMVVSGQLLRIISRERIRDELMKTVESPFLQEGVAFLAEPGVLPFMEWHQIFTLASNHHANHLLKHPNPYLRWASLLILGKIEDVGSFLREWKFPSVFIQRMQKLIAIASHQVDTEREAKRLLLANGLQQILEADVLREIIWSGVSQVGKAVWEQWDKQLPVRTMQDLSVQAKDLVGDLKKDPGPWIGKTLHYLFEQVAFGGLANDKKTLIKAARKVNEKDETKTP